MLHKREQCLSLSGKFKKSNSCYLHLPGHRTRSTRGCSSEGFWGWIGKGDPTWPVTRWVDPPVSRLKTGHWSKPLLWSSLIHQSDGLISTSLTSLFSPSVNTLDAKSWVLLSTLTKIAAFLDFPFPCCNSCPCSLSWLGPNTFSVFYKLWYKSDWVPFSLWNSFPSQAVKFI